MMLRVFSLVAVIVLSLSTASFAQSGASIRIRGTIDAVDGTKLAVTSRDGKKYDITLAPNVRITEILPASITDIKDGTFIGTAAMPQADGSLQALEVQVFPESMRGVGEGSHPFDLRPGSTMTNATAYDVVGTDGRTLTLKYYGAERKLVVPPNVPVITYAPGDMSMLKPGAHANFNAVEQQDSTYLANRVQVGKDGLVPPT